MSWHEPFITLVEFTDSGGKDAEKFTTCMLEHTVKNKKGKRAS